MNTAANTAKSTHANRRTPSDGFDFLTPEAVEREASNRRWAQKLAAAAAAANIKARGNGFVILYA